jgi:hypothetical protein
MVPARSIRQRQRGITFIGMVFLVSFIGLFVFAAVRLTPVYLEYMNVVKALESVKADAAGGGTAVVLQRAIERQFDIDNVHSITPKDIEFSRDNGELTVHAAYDAYTPFIANVGFLVHFDKTVTVAGATSP